MNGDPLKEVEDLTREVHGLVERHGKHVFQRYPLTFSLLAAFGFAAIVHGFNETVKQVDFLKQNPFLILAIGILLLLITGRLYKKLSK